MDVDSRHSQRGEHLDDELVSRRGDHVRGCAQPLDQFPLAVDRDPEPLLAFVGLAVGRLDETVALKALEGCVHLADVQRPDLAGARFKLLA